MLNEIVHGISMALNTTFGDGFEIYQNDVEQGFEEPCFFIAILKPERDTLIGRRFGMRNPFVIQYFPTESGKQDEMCMVAEQMMDALTFIDLPSGDILHGTGMSYEIVDNVLHFFVTYYVPMVKTVDPTYMETLETDFGTRKG